MYDDHKCYDNLHWQPLAVHEPRDRYHFNKVLIAVGTARAIGITPRDTDAAHGQHAKICMRRKWGPPKSATQHWRLELPFVAVAVVTLAMAFLVTHHVITIYQPRAHQPRHHQYSRRANYTHQILLSPPFLNLNRLLKSIQTAQLS